MSHHVYTTPGFVIDSRPNGEAGKLLYIFTRELGLVLAAAQGVRLGVSKLRYHTQDFSYANFSLVRGKEMWRLVGATAIEESSPERLVPIAATMSLVYFLRARVFALLRRLLHGEEANEALFDTLVSFEQYISKSQIEDEDVEFVECIIVLQVLHALGYVEHGSKGSAEIEKFFGHSNKEGLPKWSTVLISEMKSARKIAIQAINKGLKESQL